MIENDEELAVVAQRVGDDLAQIQAYLGSANHDVAKIRFPRGYMRKAVEFRRQLWYLNNETVQRNVAYAHMLSDIFRWLINRTDLYGAAEGMIIKEGICLAASIAETLTKEIAISNAVCGKNRPFKMRCQDLRDAGYISINTCSELDWLWDIRQNEHIFLVPDWEYQMYSLKEYNRAIRTLHALKADLNSFFTEQLPF